MSDDHNYFEFGHPIDNGKPTSALRLMNSERHWLTTCIMSTLWPATWII